MGRRSRGSSAAEGLKVGGRGAGAKGSGGSGRLTPQTASEIKQAVEGVVAVEVAREEVIDLVDYHVATHLQGVVVQGPCHVVGVLLLFNGGLARAEVVAARCQKCRSALFYSGLGVGAVGSAWLTVLEVGKTGDVDDPRGERRGQRTVDVVGMNEGVAGVLKSAGSARVFLLACGE